MVSIKNKNKNKCLKIFYLTAIGLGKFSWETHLYESLRVKWKKPYNSMPVTLRADESDFFCNMRSSHNMPFNSQNNQVQK